MSNPRTSATTKGDFLRMGEFYKVILKVSSFLTTSQQILINRYCIDHPLWAKGLFRGDAIGFSNG